MKIVEQLSAVQTKLKAPKNQRNTFGNYNYRSCEDILEAVKPLLKESGLTLVVGDSIESVGNRIYVKATAEIQNAEGEHISNQAFARESESKKGMDDSQITGTASSYARKYALNGLFLIDDTKDADTDEYSKTTAGNSPKTDPPPKNSPKYISKVDQASLQAEFLRVGWSINDGVKYLQDKFPKFPPKSIEHVTETQYNWIMGVLEKRPTHQSPPAP